MAVKFPTDEWIKELSAKLNESESYEKSAKNWEGDFVFVVESDDAYPDEAYLFLGLYHGKSPESMALGSLEEKPAEYIIRAPYKTWRKVVEGKIDPIQGMMTKQLKLKGNMMMIMRYPKAAKEIMNCVATIPTDFGD
ncbi:MAG: SCP2 sterol-binding domain-containing protein [Anaerolineales bacterium]|nr:SCP2 sterol-binding domain-containing protein [Anaerolineales bacterium]